MILAPLVERHRSRSHRQRTSACLDTAVQNRKTTSEKEADFFLTTTTNSPDKDIGIRYLFERRSHRKMVCCTARLKLESGKLRNLL
jgi:hypothetical protein